MEPPQLLIQSWNRSLRDKVKEEESKGSILRYKTHAFKFRESRYAVDFGKVPIKDKNLDRRQKKY